MEILHDYQLWASFVSLTVLEVVLAIDNVVFLALAVEHLEKEQRRQARFIGTFLALFFRIAMLFGIVWLSSLDQPWINAFGFNLSVKDTMMLVGGLFLIHKATISIHDTIAGEDKKNYTTKAGSFFNAIMQVVMIDIIFSFDSVITAVGLTKNSYVIIAAMIISMIIMLLSSGFIVQFIKSNITFKVLALAFVMMIGVFLVAEGLGLHLPKGYIYFGIAFSLGVEIINTIVRKKGRL